MRRLALLPAFDVLLYGRVISLLKPLFQAAQITGEKRVFGIQFYSVKGGTIKVLGYCPVPVGLNPFPENRNSSCSSFLG